MAASERPAVFSSAAIEITCVITLAGASSMNSIGAGALLLALPTIGAYFKIDSGKLTWIIASMQLISGSFLLLMGALSDLLGRKKILVFSFGWFAICSLGAGFAKNDIVFDVLRGLAGLGSAGAIPAAVGIIGSTYSQGVRKNKAFAVFSGAQPLGYVIGLLVGGIATQYIGWRANLFFLAIVFGLFTILAVFTVPSDKALRLHVQQKNNAENTTRDIETKLEDDKSIWASLKQLDFVGAGLIVIGVGLFLFALTQAGDAPHSWATSYIIATLIIGVCLMALFILWEKWMGEKALMPLNIWKYPSFGLVMVIVVLSAINFQGVLGFYATLWFQEINGVSPLLGIAYFTPMAVVGILVNIFAAYTLHLIPGKVLLLVALCAYSASALLWALQPPHLIYWAMAFPSLCLSVVGADLSYMVSNLFVVHAVPDRLQSTAGGIFNTVSTLGGTLGLGASAAIVNSISRKGPRHGEDDAHFKARMYQGAFWFAAAATILGIVLTFFVHIGKQKGDKDKGGVDMEQNVDKVIAVVEETHRPPLADKSEVETRIESGQ